MAAGLCPAEASGALSDLAERNQRAFLTLSLSLPPQLHQQFAGQPGPLISEAYKLIYLQATQLQGRERRSWRIGHSFDTVLRSWHARRRAGCAGHSFIESSPREHVFSTQPKQQLVVVPPLLFFPSKAFKVVTATKVSKYVHTLLPPQRAPFGILELRHSHS